MCWPHSPAVIYAISSTAKTSGNKKDVGVKFLRAYPNNQALALPPRQG